MSDWNPIGTAPTQMDILVYCEDSGKQYVAYNDGINRDCFTYACISPGTFMKCLPSHWMPLPALPRVISLGGNWTLEI